MRKRGQKQRKEKAKKVILLTFKTSEVCELKLVIVKVKVNLRLNGKIICKRNRNNYDVMIEMTF